MPYRLFADLVVLIHLGFILFVVAGGLLVFRKETFALIHLPAAVWGFVSELKGWVCPLTPLENRLRAMAGQASYGEGFIDHYLIPLIYPAGLTHPTQVTLGIFVLVINLLIYGYYLYRRRLKG
jgi:hypothetical protein